MYEVRTSSPPLHGRSRRGRPHLGRLGCFSHGKDRENARISERRRRTWQIHLGTRRTAILSWGGRFVCNFFFAVRLTSYVMCFSSQHEGCCGLTLSSLHKETSNIIRSDQTCRPDTVGGRGILERSDHYRPCIVDRQAPRCAAAGGILGCVSRDVDERR
jgi:hypothetical protein